MIKEALLYDKLDREAVHCFLCSHHCRIANQKFGFCGVRQNLDGVLHTHVYANPCAMNVDPIEKKPLYHFLPGSSSFSISTIGCNFRCGFCQNWEISQRRVTEKEELSGTVLPEDIVAAALKHKCKSISYTYTEPTIFFEYAYDTARLARERGLYNNFVTNGYMTQECLHMAAPYLDAANVDLKFFRDESYRKVCQARLEPVLDSIRLMRKLGIWVEITTLVVPHENDSEQELGDIAQFIAGVDRNIPWHISRFHPDYRFIDHHPTPEETLKRAQELGFKAGLNYIYVGNVWGWGNDTICHNCKKILVKREVFSILENKIKDGECGFCNTPMPGVFG